MKAITLTTTDDKFLVSIDKKYIDKSILLDLIEKIRTEHLANKLDIDESIEELGEEFKEDWWKKNKERFLKGDK